MIKKILKNYLTTSLILFSIIIALIIRMNSYNSFTYEGKQLHEGRYYLGKILSTSKKNFDIIKNIEFRNLENFIAKNKLSKKGERFIIYTSQSKTRVQTIIAIPLKNCPELDLSPKLVCNYFPKQDVIGVTRKGYLSNRDEGWKILDKELIEVNKKIFNAPFEVLWLDSSQTKDSSKWLTSLYYPIR